jgi:hypothetical protein
MPSGPSSILHQRARYITKLAPHAKHCKGKNLALFVEEEE